MIIIDIIISVTKIVFHFDLFNKNSRKSSPHSFLVLFLQHGYQITRKDRETIRDKCEYVVYKKLATLSRLSFTLYEQGRPDGNTNVRFHQEDTLKRIFERLENARIHINRARMDCGSCSEAMVEMVEKHSRHFYIRANRCVSLYDDIFALRGWKTEYINGHEFEICSIIAEKWVGKAYRLVIQRQRSINKELDLWEGEYTYRCILTNDYTSTDRDIVEYYNKRGGAERVLDDMNNGFGWKRLPKSFMAENTVFLLLTALIRNFYRHLISDANMKSFGLKRTSRIKTFVFKYVSVPAKWIKTARQHILNIYTSNDAYMMAFKFDFG